MDGEVILCPPVCVLWRINHEIYKGAQNLTYRPWLDEKKSALVKLRVCTGCERKLNYKHEKRRAKEAEQDRREAR
jgi:hypothetical protein